MKPHYLLSRCVLLGKAVLIGASCQSECIFNVSTLHSSRVVRASTRCMRSVTVFVTETQWVYYEVG